MNPEWHIAAMEARFLKPSLELVEAVFTDHAGPEEGRAVRALVEEIRAKAYHLPELELVMLDGSDALLGYCMFSRFPIEGRYGDELLLLSPVAVRPDVQRQGISKALIERGFALARDMGYAMVMVEGDPRNYNPRGFVTSAPHGVVAGPGIRLPHVSCLMVKPLRDGALGRIRGVVDYGLYDALSEQ